MNNEKKFIKPEVEIVLFASEDIIITSGDPWDSENEVGGTTGGEVPSPAQPNPFGWW